MDDITLISDGVLPVFHEVLQSYHWIFHDWHHIFRVPGLHGNQHDPRVQLFLVDLGGKREKKKKKNITPIILLFCCHDTCTEALRRACVFWDKSSKCGTKNTLMCSEGLGCGVGGLESCKQSSHRVCHVDHCFGEVLGLAAGATQLYKLWGRRRQKSHPGIASSRFFTFFKSTPVVAGTSRFTTVAALVTTETYFSQGSQITQLVRALFSKFVEFWH